MWEMEMWKPWSWTERNSSGPTRAHLIFWFSRWLRASVVQRSCLLVAFFRGQPEISLCALYVFADLGFQGFDGFEFHLGAAPAQERYFYLRLGCQFDGVEVEQMGFNGEGFLAEGWAIAHVGHRVEHFVADTGAGEVDAVGRGQFVVAAEVDGGNGVFVSEAASAAGDAGDAEDASQQAAGLGDFAACDQSANVAAGGDLAANEHDWVGFHFEAELASQVDQAAGIAFGVVAEVEVFSLVDFPGAQFARENSACEVGGPRHGEISVQRKHHQAVQSGPRPQFFVD